LRISAVIPCYNAAAYLGEALSSIESQTRPVQEVLVVDDGSSDGSAEVAERCGATVIRLGSNRGHGFARNVGWRAAGGDAVAWLDADDSWRPNHVEVVAGLLERYPEAASASGSLQRFGLDDQVVSGLIPPGEPSELLRVAFQSWLHAGSSSIMRRSALEAIGGYDEQQRVAADFDLWLRLAHHHRFVATSEITANWRWHEAQLSATPLAQILAVRRYRRRFLKTLRSQGEDALVAELEPLARPAWTVHLEGVLAMAEQRKRRSAESCGEPYGGPTTVDRARRAALLRLPPSVVNVLWHVTGGALEA
jgi:glycosyltransferase involved in cell wall biosynthesis